MNIEWFVFHSDEPRMGVKKMEVGREENGDFWLEAKRKFFGTWIIMCAISDARCLVVGRGKKAKAFLSLAWLEREFPSKAKDYQAIRENLTRIYENLPPPDPATSC
jgi:hypothetical protein